MIIVFIGSPGAGKGTQCKRLSSHLKIPHLSTGEILRKAKADRTPLGIQITEILDSGGLVDDLTISNIVEERISHEDCANGFLLDGFPRTIPQAEYLERVLENTGRPLNAVIELSVPVSVSIVRLSGRFKQTRNPRPEDKPEAITKRIDIYKRQTAPLFEFYRQRDLLRTVEGVASPKKVFHRILEAIGADEPSV